MTRSSRRFWKHDLDIESSPAALADDAERAGADAVQLRCPAARGEGPREPAAGSGSAAEAKGVFGVPAYSCPTATFRTGDAERMATYPRNPGGGRGAPCF